MTLTTKHTTPIHTETRVSRSTTLANARGPWGPPERIDLLNRRDTSTNRALHPATRRRRLAGINSCPAGTTKTLDNVLHRSVEPKPQTEIMIHYFLFGGQGWGVIAFINLEIVSEGNPSEPLTGDL